MDFCVKRSNTQEDFQNLYQNFISSRKSLVYLRLIILVFLYFTAILSLAATIWLKTEKMLFNFIFILAIAIWRTLSLLKKNTSWAKQMYTLFSKDLPETTAIFQEKKVIVKNEVEELTMNPKDIYSIYLDDDTIYLYLTKVSPFFVVKSNFESEEKWQEFYDFVKTNYCTIKRVHKKNKISKKDRIFAVILGFAFSLGIFAFFIAESLN